MIENQPNELTLIYHSDKPDDRKSRAFIEVITDYVVKSLDLKKESITETQLAEIANKMNLKIETLVDYTYKDRFQMKDEKSIHEMSDADLLTLLTQVTILIKTPIAIIGKNAYQYSSSNELLTSSKVQMNLHQQEY